MICLQFDPVAYLAELMDIAWGDAKGARYFGVLMRGYYDESGIHDGSRITTIAGWMFVPKNVRLCLEKWNEALAEKHLGMFHASSFDHFVKANKWSQDEHETFIETLTGVLGKYAWFGLCGSVVTSAYDALPSWLKKRIGGRYHFCFHVLMHQLGERLHTTGSPLPPFMVFERKDKVIGRTLDDFAEKCNFNLGAMVFDTKVNVPMLQTADFLVYEINRWLDDQLYANEKPRAQMRKLAAQNGKRYNFLLYGYHDEETLAGLVAILEGDPDHKIWIRKQWWPDSWYPNYVKPKPNAEQKLLRKTLEWNQARRHKPK
jgi:hypothetical protein